MKLNITIDGKTYEVDVDAVEPEAPAPLDAATWPWDPRRCAFPPLRLRLRPRQRRKPVKEAKVCRSPVSGIVIRVAAQVGQSLQTGDVLLVLEAMKMETNITAPGPGKIASIPVKEGDSVQSGQVVVEFE